MSVASASHGKRAPLRGVPAVGHRHAGAILEPLLAAPSNTAGCGGRSEKPCRRIILDAVEYVVRSEIACRQLPVECPPAGTVHEIFVRWISGAVWHRILDAPRHRLRVRAGRGRCPTSAMIGSQTVLVAGHGAPIRHLTRRREATAGVKRPIAVDVSGLLLAVAVTAASIQDRDAGHRLLAGLPDTFSTIRLVCAGQWLPETPTLLGSKCSGPAGRHHRTHSRQHRIPCPAPSLGGRADLRLAQQIPPLRP